MKKLFTLVAAAMMLFSASAETLTVYDGTDYLAAVPFNGSWVDEVGNKTQVLRTLPKWWARRLPL